MNKYVKIVLVALAFGAIALGIVLAGFTIPLSTGIVTDPREIFVTIGAALTGPIGALIIGFMAGIAEPGGIPLASLLAHLAGTLWMGFAYKKLVYERTTKLPMRLLGWALLVLVYYYLIVIPGFIVGLTLFYGLESPWQVLLESYPAATPEALITTAVTTLAFLALSKQVQKPLW